MSMIDSPLHPRCRSSDRWASVVPSLPGCAIPYFSRSIQSLLGTEKSKQRGPALNIQPDHENVISATSCPFQILGERGDGRVIEQVGDFDPAGEVRLYLLVDFHQHQ